METEQMLEALVTAIKESSKPTAELAQMLKQQITPVAQSRLRSINVNKIAISDTAYEVSNDSLYTMGTFIVLKYSIRNEIQTDAGCVIFEKGMLFNYDKCEYTLTQATISKDDIFITFALNADKVLIK